MGQAADLQIFLAEPQVEQRGVVRDQLRQVFQDLQRIHGLADTAHAFHLFGQAVAFRQESLHLADLRSEVGNLPIYLIKSYPLMNQGAAGPDEQEAQKGQEQGHGGGQIVRFGRRPLFGGQQVKAHRRPGQAREARPRRR